MKIKAKFKSLLAALLVLATLCTALASCADSINGDESNSDSLGSDISTDANGNVIEGGDSAENADGIITLFANGAYAAKVIRSDTPTPADKEAYTQIRDLLKKHTGVNPAFETDFVAAGDEKYDGPAILVGETNYTESTEANRKLSDSQATATISGNKYVIAFSSLEAFEKLVKKIEATLKKCTNDTVTIDSKWKFSEKVDFLSSGNETFNETGLIDSVSNVKSLIIKDNDNLKIDSSGSGQGSTTYFNVETSATKTNFNNICKNLGDNGLKKYTTNAIGNNLFATYVTKQQIVHVMYFPTQSVKKYDGKRDYNSVGKEGVIRVTVDQRGVGTDGKFSLPGLSGENKYKKTTESKMIVCDIGNADWPGGMCIIYKLADGRFFIVDAGIGGTKSDGRGFIGSSSSWIYETLAKHAADPKNIEVAAWLITHPHSDHAGGLYDMALGYYGSKNGAKHCVMPKEIKQYVKIDTLIYNAPDNLPDCNREGWIPEIIKQFKIKNVVKAHAGQVFYYADLQFTVYGSLDVMIENKGRSGDSNDFSLAIKVAFNNKTALLLGDSDTIPNAELAPIYKHELKSDILQLSHHGYGDTGDASVNSYCNPSWVLWVVSNSDQRSGQKVNVNTSIGTLKNVTHIKPGTDNLVYDSNWKLTRMTRNDMVNAIKGCDGSTHGASSCGQKPSFKNKYT